MHYTTSCPVIPKLLTVKLRYSVLLGSAVKGPLYPKSAISKLGYRWLTSVHIHVRDYYMYVHVYGIYDKRFLHMDVQKSCMISLCLFFVKQTQLCLGLYLLVIDFKRNLQTVTKMGP